MVRATRRYPKIMPGTFVAYLPPEYNDGKDLTMKYCETLERMLEVSKGNREKTGRVVARSFYKILRQNGFTHPEIMEVTGNILDEVMKDIRANGKERKDPVKTGEISMDPHSREVA